VSQQSQTFWAFGFAGGYWLLMAELFPLATRPLAASLLTGCVMLTYGITSLVAMPMVCTVQMGLLLFYAGGNLLMLVGEGGLAHCTASSWH
jgi:hypothetical protein